MTSFEPFIERPMHGGEQKIYRFPNGYAASVIRHAYSYGGDVGLWEVAVLEASGDDEAKWELTYDTPVTDDVIGRLTWDEVEDTLTFIAALGARV